MGPFLVVDNSDVCVQPSFQYKVLPTAWLFTGERLVLQMDTSHVLDKIALHLELLSTLIFTAHVSLLLHNMDHSGVQV